MEKSRDPNDCVEILMSHATQFCISPIHSSTSGGYYDISLNLNWARLDIHPRELITKITKINYRSGMWQLFDCHDAAIILYGAINSLKKFQNFKGGLAASKTIDFLLDTFQKMSALNPQRFFKINFRDVNFSHPF